MPVFDVQEETPGYHWVNTPGYSEYAVAGKPLHAVKEGENKSLCGIRRKLWNFDLFNMTRCERCAKIYEKLTGVKLKRHPF